MAGRINPGYHNPIDRRDPDSTDADAYTSAGGGSGWKRGGPTSDLANRFRSAGLVALGSSRPGNLLLCAAAALGR